MKLLEIVKDIKIKQCLILPKVWVGFSLFSRKNYGAWEGEGVFYMWSNIRSRKEGKKVSQEHFLVI